MEGSEDVVDDDDSYVGVLVSNLWLGLVLYQMSMLVHRYVWYLSMLSNLCFMSGACRK